MDIFIQNISTFPTIIYTCLLFFIALYWLTALFGLIDIDVLDVDISGDPSALEGFAGLLFKLGLAGVPLTITLTVLTLIAFTLSYLTASYVLMPFIPAALYILISGIAVVCIFFVSLYCTKIAITPLKPLFADTRETFLTDLTGMTAIVRTTKVTPTFGEAKVVSNGAELILEVRADEASAFKRGDKVVLLEWIADQRFFYVVSEDTFLNH